MTGCVSPQYHCWFDDFFETTRHSGPDVSNTICWQQLAGLSCAAQILSDIARPTQSSTVSQTIPLENSPDDLDDFSMLPQVDFDIMIDGESFAVGESQATGSSGDSYTSQAPHQAEGVTTTEPTVTAGNSRSGQSRTMPRNMAESTSQRDFFVEGPVAKVPFFQMVQISLLSVLIYSTRCEYDIPKVLFLKNERNLSVECVKHRNVPR
jgi:hypothetical protein